MEIEELKKASSSSIELLNKHCRPRLLVVMVWPVSSKATSQGDDGFVCVCCVFEVLPVNRGIIREVVDLVVFSNKPQTDWYNDCMTPRNRVSH